MKTYTKAAFLLLGSGLFLVPQALAQPDDWRGRGEPGKRMEERFLKADTNGDGKITYEEFKASREEWMKKRFDSIDANGDGAVEQIELEAAKARRMEERFSRRGKGRGRGRGYGRGWDN